MSVEQQGIKSALILRIIYHINTCKNVFQTLNSIKLYGKQNKNRLIYSDYSIKTVSTYFQKILFKFFTRSEIPSVISVVYKDNA